MFHVNPSGFRSWVAGPVIVKTFREPQRRSVLTILGAR
jgi:hypothetical protein